MILPQNNTSQHNRCLEKISTRCAQCNENIQHQRQRGMHLYSQQRAGGSLKKYRINRSCRCEYIQLWQKSTAVYKGKREKESLAKEKQQRDREVRDRWPVVSTASFSRSIGLHYSPQSGSSRLVTHSLSLSLLLLAVSCARSFQR